MTTNTQTNKKIKRKRNTKLTEVVYSASATAKELLAENETFVFIYDCIKAVTLYWDLMEDKPDMATAAAEKLQVIEESTQVSQICAIAMRSSTSPRTCRHL